MNEKQEHNTSTNLTTTADAMPFETSRLHDHLRGANKEHLQRMLANRPARERADTLKALFVSRVEDGERDQTVALNVEFVITAILDAHDAEDGVLSSRGSGEAASFCMELAKNEAIQRSYPRTWKSAMNYLISCWAETDDEKRADSIMTEIVNLPWRTDGHRKTVVEGLRNAPGASLERITNHWLVLDDQKQANRGHADEAMKALLHKSVAIAGQSTIRRAMRLLAPCDTMPEECFRRVLAEAKLGQELGEAIRKISRAAREAVNQTDYSRIFGKSFDFMVAAEFEAGQPIIKTVFWAREGLCLPNEKDITEVATAARQAADNCGVASIITWKRDGREWLLREDGQLELMK